MRMLLPATAVLTAALVLTLGQGPVTAQAPVASDDAVQVSPDGTRYVVEPPAPAPRRLSARTTTTSASRPAAIFPLDQTFTLHSLAGSKHTIFLDFTGFTVAPSSWSVNAYGLAPGAYPGFTLDTDRALSDYEKAFIQQVWRRVANLYAQFDVDVTTQDPGADAYTRTGPDDDTYGVQVAVTNSGPAAQGTCGACAGIAPVGGFDAVEATPSEKQPAFVFSTYTYGSTDFINSASLTATAAAHEVGHTFGLSHDATTAKPTSYYAGHGNWFPIMGSSDGSASIGQFSRGEYTGANNKQDDLAIIAAGGAPFRPDDYATAPAAPTDLGTHASYSVPGIIGSDADNDVVKVYRGCAGPMIVKAAGIGAGTSLDLKLTVVNAAGKVVGTSDPGSSQTSTYPDPWKVPTGVDASVTLKSAAKAAYKIKVEGVGHGDPSTTGYSGYGSVGRYTLTVSSCSTKIPGPVKPGAPRIGKASSGASGGAATATARWLAPLSAGDSPISSYTLQAVKVDSHGAVLSSKTFSKVSKTYTSYMVGLVPGRYKFRVAAVSKAGTGAWSPYSAVVTAK